MQVMFDVGPGVKRNTGAVHSMSLQARERRALSTKRGKVRAHARRGNTCECRMCNACTMLGLLGDECVSVGIIAQWYM
jgi:hypothetical protein